MKALLVDDEQRSIENLSLILTKYFDNIEIVATSSNIHSAYKKIAELKPEIVFLDVDMPPNNGFDLLRMYDQIPFEVIFVTAYDYYAIDAIKFSALYYILKPIKIEELGEAIEKAKQKIHKNSVATVEFFKNLESSAENLKRIVVNSHKGTELIELNEIIFLEARNAYTIFTLRNSRQIISSKNIKEYEDMLIHKGFFRIHRSFIVNLADVLSIDKANGGEVLLKNNLKLPLAHRRRDSFIDAIRT